MNFNLKNIFKFNHIKGKIEFKPNKFQDLLIVPSIDNIRQIGKVVRYYILWNFYGIGAKKFFGSTYFIQTNKDDNSIYKATKQYENDLFTSDIILGSFIYIGITFIVKKVIQTIILSHF